MPLRTAVFDQIIRSSWRRMIHLWRPMAVWTILVWAFGIFIFGPITSAILGWSIFRGERLVVSNEELLNWFVTPVGITYLLFSIVVILTITVLRFAGIFQIVRNDMEGKPPDIQQVILRIAANMPSILKLCAFTAVCLIILLIPLITGYIFIYHIFLGDHDINYYLLTQPAEWYYSIYSAGFYTLLWFIVFAWITGRSLLALPAYLDGHKGIRTALKCSWKLANNRTIRLLKVMTFSIIIWFFVRFSVDAFFLFSATFILEQLTGFTMSLRPVLIVTGAYISGSQLLSSIIGFTGFSFISTVLVKFYFEDTNLHQQASDPPGVAKLSNKVKKLLNYWVKPARLFLLIFFLLIASYASSRLLIDQLPKPDTVLVVAHRAGPPPAPENTLSALERGILAGAEIIEIDVQRTRDDIVVVVHDADLMRVAGDPKRISETNYIDIKEVVQLPDDGTPPGLRKVATLEEFLQATKNRVQLLIEIKSYRPDPGVAEAVIKLVQDHEMENEVMIMSPNLDIVNRLNTLAPGLRIGFVTAVSVGNLSRIPVDFLAVNHNRINPELIQSVRSQDILLFAWTVNSATTMADMIELDVDGIITDDPELAVKVRNELMEMSVTERLLLRFRQLVIDDENSEE